MSLKYQQEGRGLEHREDANYKIYLDQKLDRVLGVAKDHLLPEGVLFISSSRYAFHGAGYAFGDLPEEKLEFLDIIRRATLAGAKRIAIFGVSSEGLRSLIDYNLTDTDALKLRQQQIFIELLLTGKNFVRGPEFILRRKDGSRLSSEEVRAICEDEARRSSFIENNPRFAQVVQEQTDEHETEGKAVIGQLSNGIDALPDSSSRYMSFSESEIKEIKEQTKDIVPTSIGRIDAVGIEF